MRWLHKKYIQAADLQVDPIHPRKSNGEINLHFQINNGGKRMKTYKIRWKKPLSNQQDAASTAETIERYCRTEHCHPSSLDPDGINYAHRSSGKTR